MDILPPPPPVRTKRPIPPVPNSALNEELNQSHINENPNLIQNTSPNEQLSQPPPPPPRRRANLDNNTHNNNTNNNNTDNTTKTSNKSNNINDKREISQIDRGIKNIDISNTNVESGNAFDIVFEEEEANTLDFSKIKRKKKTKVDNEEKIANQCHPKPTTPSETQDGRLRTYDSIEDRCKVIKAIGAGSWAKVFLVDYNNEEKVLKKYNLTAMVPESLKMISDEIKTIRILKHPNIIKYEDCFFVPGFLCLILDYCNNGDLDNLISHKRKNLDILNEKELLITFRSILSGIVYIHSKGVIHRDLKPANIFINNENECIIGDFGLATSSGLNKNNEQGPMGSPRYMAPEILIYRQYTTKVDIWALGCILHELCLFKPAFDGNNYNELVENIKNQQTLRISGIYSGNVQLLIDHMLLKDGNKRPNASDLLIIVDKLISDSNNNVSNNVLLTKSSNKDDMYTIVKPLTNAGEIYLCTDLANNRSAVMKKINLKDIDISVLDRARLEFNVFKSLDYCYLLKIYDSFIDSKNSLSIVYPYCTNGTLEHIIKQQLTQKLYLNETYILNYWVPILKAVIFLHDNKLLHRNIHPSNIFLHPKYISLLGDYGLLHGANIVIQPGQPLPQINYNVTKFNFYQAPETFSGYYDEKSDIWSLGIILYELASFTTPYKGVSVMQYNQMMLTQPIPKLPSFYSPHFYSLVDKLLNKIPAARPNAKDILKEPYLINYQ